MNMKIVAALAACALSLAAGPAGARPGTPALIAEEQPAITADRIATFTASLL